MCFIGFIGFIGVDAFTRQADAMDSMCQNDGSKARLVEGTALRLLIVEGAEGEGDFDPCEILEFLSV